MAAEEQEQKPYSFVRPGVLRSRIQNRERQSALGRGLGVLLSTLGPRPQETPGPAPAALPRLEITRPEEAPEEPAPRTVGVERRALLSRIQGAHRPQAAQGMSALFQAISAASEPSFSGAAARTAVQPAPTGARVSPPEETVPEERTVTSGGHRFPLASDFMVVLMDVNLIQPNPFVPLSHIDREGLNRLTESIKAHGFLRPLVVMPSTLGNVIGGDAYWLISGERSWQVARLLGIERVPVRIHEVSPREAIQVVLADDWHIQRLPPMDRAHLCGVLVEQMGMTSEDIAERLALPVTEILATLALLDLDQEMQESLNSGAITEAAARALLRIQDPELRQEIFRYTVRYGWDPNRIERALESRREGQDLPSSP
ncbi:MAG: ParB/RepB/Spo0J family partition protein [Chloroflexi bacterium]|nr:ParB/RepB/Spo0J family partition protein [Chloroflexota bacterium]